MAWRKALLWGAFFVFTPGAGAWADCGPSGPTERVRAEFAYDGDTLKLTDGRRLRLIGLNTPELSHRPGRPSEPLADTARKVLWSLVKTQPLRLQAGREDRDRYGRLLAHVYLPDGRNLSAEMLGRGLGAHIVVPPNDGHLDCYRQAERRPRDAARGVWATPRYRGTAVEHLPADGSGFWVINGRVSRIGRSRGNIWLNLGKHLALRLPRKNLENFGELDLDDLRGRRITARGWLKRVRGQLRMTLRHPAALQ